MGFLGRGIQDKTQLNMKLYQGIVTSLLATTGYGQGTLGATATLSDADVKEVLTSYLHRGGQHPRGHEGLRGQGHSTVEQRAQNRRSWQASRLPASRRLSGRVDRA